MEQQNKKQEVIDVDQFIDNPRLVHACQKIYNAVFEPINRAIEYLDRRWTEKFVQASLPPKSQ